LWDLFPNATGVWINRVTSALIDLISIWGFYLLGSAIRGRRMGLILMALWAFSMPMTVWCTYIMGQNTTVLACVWVTLFFYRLIQKPTFSRFIYWGVAMAFGAYNYIAFRPWAPVMVTAVLLWILLGSKEKPKGIAPWVLLFGLWLSWMFLFFYINNFLSLDNPWISRIVSPPLLITVGIILFFVYVKTRFDIGDSEPNRKIFGWATGSILAVLLPAPVLFSPLYSAHSSGMLIFKSDLKSGLFNLNNLKILWDQISMSFGMMFYVNQTGVPDYPFGGHSYFESFPVLAMVIGLAYFLSKPSWIKTFIISLILVGMAPFVLSNFQHAGRVEGAVVPLFLMGAWGMDYFWGLFSREIKSGLIRKAVFLLIFGFWALDAHWGFAAFREWMASKSCDALLLQQLEKEDWKHDRVIIAQHYPQIINESTTMLCDQKEIYQLNDPNPIYLEPGQKGEDVVLLMYGYDNVMEDRVKKEFPQAQWSVVTIPDPGHPNFMKRASALSETKDKLIYVQRVPHDFWRRRFYAKDYGVARGLIWWDERVTSLSSPLPPGADVFVTARADGKITVPVTGEYVFSSDPFVYRLDLAIDGRNIINLKPQLEHPLQAKEKVYLTAGTHQVSYATFAVAFTSSKIHIMPPAGGKEWILGEPLSGQ
jgi:hypothetical protein